MSCTMFRREFLKCALASAAIIPALGAADARAAGLPLLDPADPVARGHPGNVLERVAEGGLL
jgi:hypothetical protein